MDDIHVLPLRVNYTVKNKNYQIYYNLFYKLKYKSF